MPKNRRNKKEDVGEPESVVKQSNRSKRKEKEKKRLAHPKEKNVDTAEPTELREIDEDEQKMINLTAGFSLATADKIAGDHQNIVLENFSISAGPKVLFDKANLICSYGKRFGILGKNGIGKSTLLKHIATRQLPIHKAMDMMYVEQEVDATDEGAASVVLNANVKRKRLMNRLNALRLGLEAEQEVDMDEYEVLEEEWAQNGFDKDNSIVRKILGGLGFRLDEQDKAVRLFSGGWRMRIALAQALYLEPTVLMLDEPSNHLDLNAVIWLTDYLQKYKHTVLMVSHDRNLLNQVCTDMIFVDSKQCRQFSGNYDRFLRSVLKQKKQHEREWEKIEKEVKRMRKKGVPKKEVIKFLDKAKVGRPEREYEVKISFFEPTPLNGIMAELQDVSFGYGDQLLFENTNFCLTMDSRVAIVGPNGVGKSTFIRLITGDIDPKAGTVYRNQQCRIGYYSQHFAATLPLDASPVEYLVRLFEQSDPDNELGENMEQYVRSLLGRIGLEGSHHKKLMKALSGGQKARVAFVSLFVTRPHIILLDEPSNHLDIETVDGLIDAINAFSGGVVIISHDVDLITRTGCLLYDIAFGDKCIEKFSGDYEDYQAQVLAEVEEFQ